MPANMENDRCDLDPNKLCDNCCKCLEKTETFTDESGYRVITAEFASGDVVEEDEQSSAIAALFAQEDEDAEDPYELDPLEVPPELMAEWEAKLAASFREEQEEQNARPMLHGSRRRRE